MSQLARLGFILLGLGLILEPLSMAGSQFLEARPGNLSIEGLGFAAGWWAIFGLVPGLLLCAKSGLLAQALFPEGDQDATLDTRALITAGVVVLGAYFIVTGLAVAGGAGAMLILTAAQFPQLTGSAVGSVLTGLLEVVVGAVLVMRARRVTRFLFRDPHPERAAA